MAEYIEREPMIEEMQRLIDNVSRNFPKATETELIILKGKYEAFTEYIKEQPAADVQPVDRWVSVDEALPIYDGLVLICYNDKTIRLAIYSEDGWYSDEGNPIMEQPDYWVRIPEPPDATKG